eukprot:Skav227748  [mRNA]  locus=scaffold3513:489676:491666:- [translate_table: standard]
MWDARRCGETYRHGGNVWHGFTSWCIHHCVPSVVGGAGVFVCGLLCVRKKCSAMLGLDKRYFLDICRQDALSAMKLPEEDSFSLKQHLVNICAAGASMAKPHVISYLRSTVCPAKGRNRLSPTDGTVLRLRRVVMLLMSEPHAVSALVAGALGHVHARCIMHRGVKAENVMVVNKTINRCHVKLIDFGWLGCPKHKMGPLIVFARACRRGQADTSQSTRRDVPLIPKVPDPGMLQEFFAVPVQKAELWPDELAEAVQEAKLSARGLLICAIDARSRRKHGRTGAGPRLAKVRGPPSRREKQFCFLAFLALELSLGFYFIPSGLWKGKIEAVFQAHVSRKAMKSICSTLIMASSVFPTGSIPAAQMHPASPRATLPQRVASAMSDEQKKSFGHSLHPDRPSDCNNCPENSTQAFAGNWLSKAVGLGE